jgi:hypothetical protein
MANAMQCNAIQCLALCRKSVLCVAVGSCCAVCCVLWCMLHVARCMRQPIEGSEHFSFDTSSLASPFVSPSLQKVLLSTLPFALVS